MLLKLRKRFLKQNSSWSSFAKKFDYFVQKLFCEFCRNVIFIKFIPWQIKHKRVLRSIKLPLIHWYGYIYWVQQELQFVWRQFCFILTPKHFLDKVNELVVLDSFILIYFIKLCKCMIFAASAIVFIISAVLKCEIDKFADIESKFLNLLLMLLNINLVIFYI